MMKLDRWDIRRDPPFLPLATTWLNVSRPKLDKLFSKNAAIPASAGLSGSKDPNGLTLGMLIILAKFWRKKLFSILVIILRFTVNLIRLLGF